MDIFWSFCSVVDCSILKAEVIFIIKSDLMFLVVFVSSSEVYV